jgi:prolyl-tRNA synthetase
MSTAGPDPSDVAAQVNVGAVMQEEVPDSNIVPPEAGVDGQMSKNAAKKLAKREKQAAEKSSKPKERPVGSSEAKKAGSKPAKKKIEGAALIGIDVAKEEDFSGWYQQVLTKGDMMDYYDVSGCYILKVSIALIRWPYPTNERSLPLISFGNKYNHGSTPR